MDHQGQDKQALEKNSSSKRKRYVYGLVTFVLGVTKKDICDIINEDRMKLLRQQHFDIFSALRKRIDIFERIQSCRFTKISGRASKINQRQLIMLTTVKYERLRNLDLCDNQITKIESLVALDAPLLGRLGLYYNHISNVSNFLSKLTFKRLQSILLSTNPFFSFTMGRCKASFRPSETTEIDLGETILLDQGISFLAKTDHRHGQEIVSVVQMKITPTDYYPTPEKYEIIQRRVLRSLKQKDLKQ